MLRRPLTVLLFIICQLGSQASRAQDHVLLDFQRAIGAPGDGLGQFRAPQALAVDLNGNIYVADTGNHRVQWFAPDGSFQRYFGGIGSGREQFDTPTDICAPDGLNVYVTDYQNHRLHQLDRRLNPITLITGDSWPADFVLRFPAAIAVSQQGDLFIAEQERNSIFKINSFLVPVVRFGHIESGESVLLRPVRLAIDPERNLYVADADAGRLAVFDYFGNFLAYLGEKRLQRPTGLCWWQEGGGLLIADEKRAAVLLYKSETELQECRILQKQKEARWQLPTDLAVYHQNLLVLDRERSQILVYRMLTNPSP